MPCGGQLRLRLDLAHLLHAERERALHKFTLYDEQSGKAVTAKEIAARLAEVGLRPLSSACSDMRLQLEDKFEQLQAHELEAEGLLILLQGTCADVSHNSANLQRHVLVQVEQLKEALETRGAAMLAQVRERERFKLAALHEQIARMEKEYDKMKRASVALRAMLRDHASLDPVEFMSACTAADERINPVLRDAAAISYQPEESADLSLTLDTEAERLLLAHTNFQENKTPPAPSQIRVIKLSPQYPGEAGAGGEASEGGAGATSLARAAGPSGSYSLTVGWSMDLSPILSDVPAPRR